MDRRETNFDNPKDIEFQLSRKFIVLEGSGLALDEPSVIMGVMLDGVDLVAVKISNKEDLDKIVNDIMEFGEKVFVDKTLEEPKVDTRLEALKAIAEQCERMIDSEIDPGLAARLQRIENLARTVLLESGNE